MAGRSTKALEAVVSEAAQRVTVGGRYRHYQSEGTYEVLDIVLLENTYEAGVLYKSSEAPQLVWVRPISNWLEIVRDASGKTIQRFEQVLEED